MRVRAKQMEFESNVSGPVGEFGGRARYVGDEFDIPNDPKGADGLPRAYSRRWMEQVEPVAETTGHKAKPKARKAG